MAGSEATAGGGDGISSSLAGMSKNQLYDIMSQMKTLIEQNQQQARQILIQNPLLTRALFQAQIMLGMVHPPQSIPNIQPTASQPPSPSQSIQPTQPTNIQPPQSLPLKSDLIDQTSASQTSNPIRKQHQFPPNIPPPSTSALPMNLPPPPLQSHSLHNNSINTANNAQVLPQMPLPHSSQVHHNIPHPIQPPPMPQISSSQLQPPLPTHMMMQPPLPPQPRPPSMPNFSHQPQMGPATAFQHPGAPQLHQSQPMFHPSMKPPVMGQSFPQGQPLRPSQPPSHPMYQVGNPHSNTEFGNQLGNSMQPERGGAPTWIPGLPEISSNNNNNMAPPPPPPLQMPSLAPSSQTGLANQPRPPAPLTPEMEQALLQQVMSLTQEQINLLPPEQRNQVLQLQQMLRQ